MPETYHEIFPAGPRGQAVKEEHLPKTHLLGVPIVEPSQLCRDLLINFKPRHCWENSKKVWRGKQTVLQLWPAYWPCLSTFIMMIGVQIQWKHDDCKCTQNHLIAKSQTSRLHHFAQLCCTSAQLMHGLRSSSEASSTKRCLCCWRTV